MDLSVRHYELLEKIAQSKDGILAEQLKISEDEFLYLYDCELISEAEVVIKYLKEGTTVAHRVVSHHGNIMISERGKSVLSIHQSEQSEKEHERMRNIITTIIAIAAAIKSFWPEITRLVDYLKSIFSLH